MDARLLKDAPEEVEGDSILIPIFERQTMVPTEVQNLDMRLRGAIA